MPSLPRLAGRSLLAAVLALAVVAALAMAAETAFPPTNVTIVTPKHRPVTVGLDDIKGKPEITNPCPTIRRPGSPEERVDVDRGGGGISVRQILSEKELEFDYATIAITRPDGSVLTLTQDDVDKVCGPLFYVDATGQVRFLRPSTGSKDYNARDDFAVNSSGITLVRETTELDVELKASREKIDVGESVDFTASVSPRGDYRYDWGVTDGSGDKNGGRTFKHKFKKAGKYTVTVGVKIGTATSNSGTASVRIEVGDVDKADEDQDGPATTPSTPPVTPGSSDAPYNPVTPSTPTPSPPTPTPDAPEPPDVATSGPTISGNLLADASDPPDSSVLESAAKAAQQGKSKKEDGPEGASVSTAALGIAGLFGLLGLGAGLELRQGSLRRGGRSLRLRLPRRGA